MKRVAFTIILNGLRHLVHNDYYKAMCSNFDLWVIIEGVACNTGSTSWCNKLPSSMHNNFISNDGTSEFLDKLKETYNNVKVVRTDGQPWLNKDEQVNSAIDVIKKTVGECFLWQVDIDEQWTVEQLEIAEKELTANNGKTGCFYCNFYVGKNLIAVGDWGEGRIEPYRRLWKWAGESFVSHEPPKLLGDNNPRLLLTPKFNHYSYYFDEDVKFKETYYGNYSGLYDRWLAIQSTKGSLHIRFLLGDKVWWSNTNTNIQYKEYVC